MLGSDGEIMNLTAAMVLLARQKSCGWEKINNISGIKSVITAKLMIAVSAYCN